MALLEDVLEDEDFVLLLEEEVDLVEEDLEDILVVERKEQGEGARCV